jgi:lysozyme
VPLYPTFFLSCGCFVVHHYSNGLAYYFSFKSNKVLHQEEDKRISDVRNLQVLDNHAGKAIGLDVSEYQGKINWVMWILGKYPVHFVFIRHRGNDRQQFDENWRGAKSTNLIREPIIIVPTKIH